jgi:hypothetical protein
LQSAETRGAEGRSLICMFIGTPLYRPVQKLDPVYREGDGREILFHLALQEAGSHLVQCFDSPIRCRVLETKPGRGSLSTESRRNAFSPGYDSGFRIAGLGQTKASGCAELRSFSKWWDLDAWNGVLGHGNAVLRSECVFRNDPSTSGKVRG